MPAYCAHPGLSKTSAHIHLASRDSLQELPVSVRRPKYTKISPGILHIGCSNFALAHLASYVHDLLAIDPRWGIVAASLKSRQNVDALRKQDGIYLLVERQGVKHQATAVAAVCDTIFAPDNPRAVIEQFGKPHIKMVTCTVTNKGYHLAGPGTLDFASEDISHDVRLEALDLDSRPRSLLGNLAAGLQFRRRTINKPMTILSLDNIERNTASLKSLLMQFLEKAGDSALMSWIERAVDFPATVVDRINPKPTESLITAVQDSTEVRSDLTIVCETFKQLVVERGRFESTTPSWEAVGVQVVDSCTKHWQQKFYQLNASHLIAALCGQRMGVETIHETICIPAVEKLITRAQLEWATFLVPRFDDQKALHHMLAYTANVRPRFADPSLCDTNRRVAARASSKISERLLSSISLATSALPHMRASRLTLHVPALATALYLHTLSRRDEKGGRFDADDPDYERVRPVHNVLLGHLATTPAPANSLSLHAAKDLLCQLGSILGKPSFAVLATSDSAFVQSFAWAAVAIHQKPLASAIMESLSFVPLPPFPPPAYSAINGRDAEISRRRSVHMP
ncbi:hypothetical protein HDU88_007986 [Geranomyces variabilis]|nr:hypothetical protein HDU88_007986 [Geranomyces variabilis]